MKKVINPYLLNEKTILSHEDNFKFNAPHYFEVRDKEEGLLGKVHFQEGPIKEYGINGITESDLIAMLINRLEHFQNSIYKSRENEYAIKSLTEALMWLNHRTLRRTAEGTEGTSVV